MPQAPKPPRDVSVLSPQEFLAIKGAGETTRTYSGRKTAIRDPQVLPRIIHMFWDKGFEAAPEIIQLCKRSWEINNPGWTFNILDMDAAREVVDIDSFPDRPGMAGYSDLLRLHLLQQHGGVWADATVLSLRPLDDWLPGLFAQAPMFAFNRPATDRMLSTWLLAAEKDTPLIADWTKLSREYWSTQIEGQRPYPWVHYLFEYLIRTNKDHRQMWNRTPRLSATPVHHLLHFYHGLRKEETVAPMLRYTPVQKVTYKRKIEPDQLKGFFEASRPELAHALF